MKIFESARKILILIHIRYQSSYFQPNKNVVNCGLYTTELSNAYADSFADWVNQLHEYV